MTYQPKVCEYCGKLFNKNVDEAIARWNKRLYCSRKCNDNSKRTAPKTSTKKYCNQCGKIFDKPYELSWIKWQERRFCSKECADTGKIRKAPSTAFKKGSIPANYKQTGYGYSAVHQWVNRHYQKTGICTSCGETKKTQWANISGKYLRVRNDYLELCYSCHTKMDKDDPKNPRYTGGSVA